MNRNKRGRPQAAPQTPAKKSGPTVAPTGAKSLQAAIHEPSAWLRGRVAELARRAQRLGFDVSRPSPVIVMPLGSSGAPGTRADRECDRCAKFVPDGSDLYASKVHAFPGLLLIGGLCHACATLEVGSVSA